MSKYPQVVLVGYPGSQKIARASKYLTAKYMPMFNPIYLNYQDGINGWAEYVANFLKYLTEPWVIFALDDYLISNLIDINEFKGALYQIRYEDNTVCVKLCETTIEEHEEYPVTTQYCIWNRQYLIWILEQVHTPWQFEILGSQLFKNQDRKIKLPEKKSVVRTCLRYDTHSALSGRWKGVNLNGLLYEDVKYLKDNEYV